MQVSNQSESKSRKLWQSDMALIIGCYLLLDLLVRGGFYFYDQNNKNQFAFQVPHRTRIWYACNDFLKLQKTPDVVMLGASDMTCAMYTAEATYLNKTQSQLLNHTSRWLDAKMTEFHCPYRSNFCFAIPGEMMSDAYFIINTMVVPKGLPKQIVLSMVPRDLCDATFGDISDTDIYKLMSKLGGTADHEMSYRKSIWDKLGYLVSQSLSVYQHKWEFESWQHQALHGLLTAGLGTKFDDAVASLPVRRVALHELPEDFGPNEVMQSPFDPAHAIFADNIAEYRSRYARVRPAMYKMQLGFVEKIAQLCQDKGVALLVVYSPVTEENRAMLPPGVWDRYIADTTKVVRQYGGNCVDLNTPGLFAHSDFADSVHLNGIGGLKYFAHISSALAQTSSVASSGKSSF